MDDNLIIDLYWQRAQSAISETALKYGSYCFTIAANILRDDRDSEECVNDTYLKTWETIPPTRPTIFHAFLGRITRNISLNMFKAQSAMKRGGGNLPLIFEELGEFLPTGNYTEEQFNASETARLISRFLRGLDKESRVVFVLRYWYGDSIKTIAESLDLGESNVKMKLHRARGSLKACLEKEGIEV